MADLIGRRSGDLNLYIRLGPFWVIGVNELALISSGKNRFRQL
jgi:hypothetical protein